MSGGLNLWVESTFKWKLINKSIFICKTFPFFTYTMLQYSVTIIVIITAEKFYAVLFPMKANNLKFKRKRLITIILSAFLICALINSHFLYSLTILEINAETSSITNKTTHNLKICSYYKWFSFYEKVWIYIDASIYSFLPLILISIFNASIVILLIKERNKSLKLQQPQCTYSTRNRSYEIRNKSLKIQQPQCSSSSRNSTYPIKNKKSLATQRLKSCRNSELIKSSNSGRRMAIVEYNHNNSIVVIAFKHKSKNYTDSKHNKRISLTIFIVNTTFCVLTMPLVILQIIESNRLDKNKYDGEKKNELNSYKNNIEILKSIFELLQYLNHSINFVLYCLSAETFREEILIIFSNIKKRLLQSHEFD